MSPAFVTSLHLPRHTPRQQHCSLSPPVCALPPPDDQPPPQPDDNSSWTALSERVSQLRDREVARDRRLATNWHSGNYDKSIVAATPHDYVRKVSFHADVLACGTASGGTVLSSLRHNLGARLRCVNAHVGQVTALHYADAHLATAGASDHSVAVWRCAEFERPAFWTGLKAAQDAELPQPDLRIDVHNAIVTQIVIDAPDRRIYSASVDGTVRVSHLDSGELLLTLRVGEPIFSMALTDNKYLLLGCASGRVQAYQARRGLFLLSISCHDANTTALDFFEDNQILVTGDSSGNVRAWSFRDSTCLGDVAGHDDAVTSLQVDHSKIVSAGRDGRISVSRLNGLGHLYSITGFTKYLSTASFDKTRLISDGTNDIIVCHHFDAELDNP